MRTRMGDIRGTEVMFENNKIHSYLGIPFAKPPIDDLRFEKPVATEKFTEIFNATNYGPMCPQIFIDPKRMKRFENMSEDCLTLNIFAPKRDQADTALAVVVWIYGGAFVFGQSDIYNPVAVVTRGNIVFITINYRIGVLGFLSSGDKAIPGNYGLWDQHLAIKWVHDNIDAFGGDHNMITIIGESAGAASVGYQTMSSKSRGLFRRAILQSGSANAFWALSRNAKTYSQKLGSLLGCDLIHLASCLRKQPLMDLLNSSMYVNGTSAVDRLLNFVWVPVVDEDFVPYEPMQILNNMSYLSKETDFFKYDTMYDTVTNEGAVFYNLMGAFLKNASLFMPTITKALSRNYYKNKILHTIIIETFGKSTNLFVDIVNNAYRDLLAYDSTQTAVTYEELFNLIGDSFIVMPSLESARVSSHGIGSTYYYRMAHVPSYRSNVPVNGVAHAEDMIFTFGFPSILMKIFGVRHPVSSDEHAMSHTLITYICNFAKTG